MTFVIAILYFLVPLLILKGAGKIKLIAVLSPVVCCYVAGLILGNLPLGLDLKAPLTTISEVSVLLSIPLLLFSTHFAAWLRLARKTVISFILVVFSVMIVATISAFMFKDQVEEASKVASMLVGVYTGGTPNLVAIGMALKVKQETFVLINAADLILGALYLLFAMTIGKKLLAKFLPAFEFQQENQEVEVKEHSAWERASLKDKFQQGPLLLFLAALIVGVSVGSSQLLLGELFVPYIIMVISALAIGCSFVKNLRERPGSFEIGQYLLLVFCMSIGSMANIKEIMQASGIYLLFCTTVMIGAISLHFLLCWICKIDRDTAMITSVAGIFGPAFVGPFASILKNREIVVSGVTSGLVGYALGNYLGLLLYYLLT